ncbi:MAG: MBL fold metallo-hydrolase [Bacteriovoracaceae bacterium]|nr:MBL fold metallo-hydrolase [Bacteriovoracaceae bacterium]
MSKFLLTILLASCMSSQSIKPKLSDHFDGKQFHNRHPGYEDKSLFTVLKWKLTSASKSWPVWVENEKFPAVPQQVNQGITATFVNHASVLLQFDGLNVITDPIWSKRASPISWAGPKRVREPGIKMESLPKIDIILISHNHYDHLDLPTLQKLQKKFPDCHILVGLGNASLLNESGLKNVHELDWGEEYKLGKSRFIFEEANHWSARGVFDKRETLWGSFVIESSAGKIFFAGDTGYAPHFNRIGKEYGPFKLSLLPIGAYEPRWFMKAAHMNPEDAVMAHKDLKSQNSIAIHFGTFALTDEGIDDPATDLQKARSAQDHFSVLKFGESKSWD